MKNKKYIVLIIYDIVDNKTRARMVKCLESFAIRVQKSAFEGILTEGQYQRLIRMSSRIIDHSSDSLRIYILDSVVNVYTWGRAETHEDDCIVL